LRAVQRSLWPTLVAALLLGIWQAWTTMAQVPSYIVPSPLAIAHTLVQDWPLLAPALLVTLKITALSLLAAVLLGTLIAFAFVQSRWIEAAFFPYAVLLQVTPIVSIAPLIIIWVKDPTASLVVCATLVALFPIISNTTIGLRTVNPGLAAYFQLQGASRWQTLLRLRIPSALPYFFAGLRISGGLALIGAVVAEFVHWRHGHRPGLPDSAKRLPAQHPTPVRGAGADHADGHRGVREPGGLEPLDAGRLARERDALKAHLAEYPT